MRFQLIQKFVDVELRGTVDDFESQRLGRPVCGRKEWVAVRERQNARHTFFAQTFDQKPDESSAVTSAAKLGHDAVLLQRAVSQSWVQGVMTKADLES